MCISLSQNVSTTFAFCTRPHNPIRSYGILPLAREPVKGAEDQDWFHYLSDRWKAIPAASRLVTQQIGGRVRGPSPLLQQWVEFCLQPERALPFKEEIIPGASPLSLKATVEQPRKHKKGRPKLETNLVANAPPAGIFQV